MGKYENRSGYPIPVFDLGEDGLYADGSLSSYQSWEDTSIASGSVLSDVIDLGEAYHAVGMYSENLSGSTVSFLAGYDVTHLGLLQDIDGPISFSVVGRSVSLNTGNFYPWRYIQIKLAAAKSTASSIKIRKSTI